MPEYDEATTKAVRDAEAAHQRSVCHVPKGDLPQPLSDALDRRVEVNLAQTKGERIVRIGGSDAQVRTLEAPFSRRRGVDIDAPTNGGRRRRRTAKKAAAKKRGTS